MKKMIAVCMASALLLTSCAGDPDTEDLFVPGEVKLWTAYGTEKIIQDKTYERDSSTLVIKAFKNEYESGQIILTPDYDVREYTIALSDLTCGENTLSKDNFEIYNQKYIRVSTIKDSSPILGAVVGNYPDALLPMESAIEYGENKAESGKNQGIWITLKVPKEQAAGIYTGNFKVTVDGNEKIVPVEITVYDYAITDESHTKSSYAVYINELAQGEQERTVEMEKAYVDFLLDYRMSPQDLPDAYTYGSKPGEYAYESFLNSAVEYTKNVKCSYFNIPFETVSMDFGEEAIATGSSQWQSVIDIDNYEDILEHMLARSLEENVNLFSKAGNYLLFADEYAVNGTTLAAKYSATAMKASQEKLAETYAAALEAGTLASSLDVEGEIDAEFAAECIEGLRTLKSLMTGKIQEGLFDTPVTYVPVIDEIHTEEEREKYEEVMDAFETEYNEEGELWLYHALNPKSPYPTVHIEDNLLTCRMMGWMMYQYNYVGSLYWDVTLYAWRKDNWNNLPLQDYYDTALRFPEANGDGFLVYPGKPYGIYGPVGSVRLHAFRDAMEDYEVLYQLEENYKKIAEKQGVTYDGEAFEELMEMLSLRLYSGTQTKLNSEIDDTFMQARELLAELLDLTSKTETTIEQFTMQDGVAKVTLSTAEGNTVKINGNNQTGTTASGRTVYEFTQSLTKESNYFDLSVTTSKNVTVEVNFYLSGKFITYDAGNYADKFTVYNQGSGEIVSEDGMNVFKANCPAGEGSNIGLYLDASAFNLDKQAKSITLNIYNYGSEDITLTIKALNGSTRVDLLTMTLKPGVNKVNYSLSLTSGKYSRLYFVADKASILGIGNIIVEG